MILSDECWMKNELCKKFLHKDTCECKSKNIFCLKLFKINTLLNLTLLTDKQKQRAIILGDTVDDTKYEMLNTISKNIVSFVNDGKNLYIYSPISGNCKTTWAIRLLQDYIYNIWASSDIMCRGLFINIPRFLLELKQSITTPSEYIDHIKTNIYDADIVIWDDIATKMATEFEAENLLSIIDTRINSNKSNIFTSNVDSAEMYSLMGTRLASRIVNLSTNIKFEGGDKRLLANMEVSK